MDLRRCRDLQPLCTGNGDGASSILGARCAASIRTNLQLSRIAQALRAVPRGELAGNNVPAQTPSRRYIPLYPAPYPWAFSYPLTRDRLRVATPAVDDRSCLSGARLRDETLGAPTRPRCTPPGSSTPAPAEHPAVLERVYSVPLPDDGEACKGHKTEAAGAVLARGRSGAGACTTVCAAAASDSEDGAEAAVLLSPCLLRAALSPVSEARKISHPLKYSDFPLVGHSIDCQLVAASESPKQPPVTAEPAEDRCLRCSVQRQSTGKNGVTTPEQTKTISTASTPDSGTSVPVTGKAAHTCYHDSRHPNRESRVQGSERHKIFHKHPLVPNVIRAADAKNSDFTPAEEGPLLYAKKTATAAHVERLEFTNAELFLCSETPFTEGLGCAPASEAPSILSAQRTEADGTPSSCGFRERRSAFIEFEQYALGTQGGPLGSAKEVSTGGSGASFRSLAYLDGASPAARRGVQARRPPPLDPDLLAQSTEVMAWSFTPAAASREPSPECNCVAFFEGRAFSLIPKRRTWRHSRNVKSSVDLFKRNEGAVQEHQNHEVSMLLAGPGSVPHGVGPLQPEKRVNLCAGRLDSIASGVTGHYGRGYVSSPVFVTSTMPSHVQKLGCGEELWELWDAAEQQLQEGRQVREVPSGSYVERLECDKELWDHWVEDQQRSQQSRQGHEAACTSYTETLQYVEEFWERWGEEEQQLQQNTHVLEVKGASARTLDAAHLRAASGQGKYTRQVASAFDSTGPSDRAARVAVRSTGNLLGTFLITSDNPDLRVSEDGFRATPGFVAENALCRSEYGNTRRQPVVSNTRTSACATSIFTASFQLDEHTAMDGHASAHDEKVLEDHQLGNSRLLAACYTTQRDSLYVGTASAARSCQNSRFPGADLLSHTQNYKRDEQLRWSAGRHSSTAPHGTVLRTRGSISAVTNVLPARCSRAEAELVENAYRESPLGCEKECSLSERKCGEARQGGPAAACKRERLIWHAQECLSGRGAYDEAAVFADTQNDGRNEQLGWSAERHPSAAQHGTVSCTRGPVSPVNNVLPARCSRAGAEFVEKVCGESPLGRAKECPLRERVHDEARQVGPAAAGKQESLMRYAQECLFGVGAYEETDVPPGTQNDGKGEQLRWTAERHSSTAQHGIVLCTGGPNSLANSVSPECYSRAAGDFVEIAYRVFPSRPMNERSLGKTEYGEGRQGWRAAACKPESPMRYAQECQFGKDAYDGRLQCGLTATCSVCELEPFGRRQLSAAPLNPDETAKTAPLDRGLGVECLEDTLQRAPAETQGYTSSPLSGQSGSRAEDTCAPAHTRRLHKDADAQPIWRHPTAAQIRPELHAEVPCGRSEYAHTHGAGTRAQQQRCDATDPGENLLQAALDSARGATRRQPPDAIDATETSRRKGMPDAGYAEASRTLFGDHRTPSPAAYPACPEFTGRQQEHPTDIAKTNVVEDRSSTRSGSPPRWASAVPRRSAGLRRGRSRTVRKHLVHYWDPVH